MSVRLRGGLACILIALAALAGACALTVPQRVQAGAAEFQKMAVSARPFRNFQIGSEQTHFGVLEFVGGLELTASSSAFGGMSALRFLTPGEDFIGVSDTGYWFFGKVLRDSGGRPAGFGDFRMQPMHNREGVLTGDKRELDAESLAVRDGVATVGYEHDHRIVQFRIGSEGMKPAFRELDFLIPGNELRQNSSFEAIVHAHPQGPHEGALVVVTERSLDAQGNHFAAVLEGPHKGVFTVKRYGDFGITDGAFLPDGDLLLLERSFSIAAGVKMRLRRIPGESVKAGAVADGPVLLEATMRHQIDNMEALDVWTRADGALMVSILSDDNHSLLQRNLYLEFILHDEPR